MNEPEQPTNANLISALRGECKTLEQKVFFLERTLALLVTAGFVSSEKVAQAKELAK